MSLEQKNPFGGSKPMKVTVNPDSKIYKRQQAIKNVNSDVLASVKAQNRLQQLAQSALKNKDSKSGQTKPDMEKFFAGDF